MNSRHERLRGGAESSCGASIAVGSLGGRGNGPGDDGGAPSPPCEVRLMVDDAKLEFDEVEDGCMGGDVRG